MVSAVMLNCKIPKAVDTFFAAGFFVAFGFASDHISGYYDRFAN